MIVAYVGHGALDDAVVKQIRGTYRVEQVADAGSLAQAVRACDVLVLGASAPRGIGEQLAQWPTADLGRLVTVVDQRVADPADTQAFAAALANCGVTLVDAPIHCDKAEDFPERSATLCGGADDDIARVRPVLDAMGAKVVHFGGVGTGHTARALVGAAAACNRMATYECAAAGFANGLSIADMALVLNRSSGANSASEHVLPYIGSGTPTTHMPLSDVTDAMRLASQLAMRAGTPLLLASVVGELVQSLANGLGAGATFDDAIASMETAAGLKFA